MAIFGCKKHNCTNQDPISSQKAAPCLNSQVANMYLPSLMRVGLKIKIMMIAVEYDVGWDSRGWMTVQPVENGRSWDEEKPE